MKLKVCGMKYADNIHELLKVSPDFVGFIFYNKSKRYVGDDFIMPDIPSSIKKVGVFVNEKMETITDTIKKYSLDYVQLHGDESADFCNSVSENTPVIKAFGIDKEFDFSLLNDYDNACDYFLFDTKSLEYGGTGKRFDMSLLINNKSSKPYFLSGGIGADILSQDLNGVKHCFALDVNSKFEIEPGRKDINQLKVFVDELSSK